MCFRKEIFHDVRFILEITKISLNKVFSKEFQRLKIPLKIDFAYSSKIYLEFRGKANTKSFIKGILYQFNEIFRNCLSTRKMS